MNFLAVVTTVATRAEAQGLARSIVERGLAACAQISEIESFYTWNGAVQNEREFRVVLKTTDLMYKRVEHAIREMHSYKVPAIYALPVEQIYEPYATWLAGGSRGE